MAVNIQNCKDFSFENLHQTEREVIMFCSKYNNRPTKATVHDLMEDVEKFSTNTILKSNIPLHVQCRWVTAIANQPWLVPENSSIAEVQVNSLLQYMSSSNLWVRSLACSLVRVFSGELNPNGQHIITQVTIICKNLMTTIEGSMASDVESTGLCEIVACSSLCYIANYWLALIPQKSTPFVLLAIKTFLNILEKPRTDVTPFIYQVASDSLTQVFHVPILWLGILNDKERLEAVARLLGILQYFSSQKKKENITIIKLLQATNMDNLLRTMIGLPDSVQLLLGILLELLPPVTPTDDAPFLEVRWLSLCIIWRFLHMIGIAADDNTALLTMINKGCSSVEQVTYLHKLVSTKFKEYLTMGGFKVTDDSKAIATSLP